MSQPINTTPEKKEKIYSQDQLEFIDENCLPSDSAERSKYIYNIEKRVASEKDEDQNPELQVLLGKYYVLIEPEYGLINKGRQYLEKAVENGNTEACYLLGQLYEEADLPSYSRSPGEWNLERERLKKCLKTYEQGDEGGCLECKNAVVRITQNLQIHEAKADRYDG